MTKEGLERIKEAYYSGLKVQIWFNGHWEDFDARDYSMYSDPFSEHRQYRIVGSAYADIAEKRIAELEEQLTQAKELIKRLIKATYGEGWNYSLQVKVEAEKFLEESEKF